MRKVNRLPYLCFIALILLVVSAICGVFSGKQITAGADSYTEENEYSYYFVDYSVTYDIKKNREISVEEYLTIKYTGLLCTGFYRDIPVNHGEMVKNVNVAEIKQGRETSVMYVVERYSDDDGNSYISVDIGDTTRKRNQTCTYRITYQYCLTRAQEEKGETDNVLYLNAIGAGRESWNYILNANVKMILPDGYKSAKCFIGSVMSEKAVDFTTSSVDGRTALILNGVPLKGSEGVTFKMYFEKGSLSKYFDFTPYYFLMGGAAILLLLVIVKFAFFNKSLLTPVLNFEAPNKMDPLMMGKLIDNKVNSEDISAMIFYWADKGYLKINLDDQNDPTLIRLVRHLPENRPKYERLMFEKLFGNDDMTYPSKLKYSFYKTVERVTAMVNENAKGLYSGVSLGVSVIFALLAGLLLGVAPFVLAITQVSNTLIVLEPFLSVVPGGVLYAFGVSVKFNSLKLDKKKKLLFGLGIAGISAFFCLLYAVLVPTSLFGGYTAKVVLCAMSCVIIGCSVFIVSRTRDYTQKLNEIVGFRNFIQLAEKDRLETLLEDDPQFYYHVLPYAQVLGVSDKWQEKFEGLTVEPPQWVTSSYMNTMLEFHLLNSLIRSSMGTMSSNMVSRPSSSGSGGYGGFGGGGHVGGGHGGGGFRGR